ncbi:MAG: hypothetical protein QHH19_06375 [Candidatus Thermoplasmatota archaeon]|jgi:hypothetical protein|nr:hypothetical protein [Candidatus Thermoplasmatota archaeon]
MKERNIDDNVKQDIIEIFETVKEAVRRNEGRSRAGLMLGLQELGASFDGFIGAYHPVTSNIIVLNKTPLRRIIQTNKKLLKPYIFHILLHEYIHALGFLDEYTTQKKTYEISKKYFGEKHIVTQLSADIKKFLPNIVHLLHGWMPPEDSTKIELVQGFDRSSTNFYIN